MIITFSEEFKLPVAEVYSYFETPADWTRLFGFAGETRDLGDGWFSVALKNFPFPLVAKNIRCEPNSVVSWTFRGFWRGRGEVRFEETPDGVKVDGFEEIAVRWLFFLSPVVERILLERTFRSVWAIGWYRLRKRTDLLEAAENRGE